MNRITPLDIRVAVLAHPLVLKGDSDTFSPFLKTIAPYAADERLVSVFQNSAKPSIEHNAAGIPPLIRKAQLVLFHVFELLKALFEQKAKSTILDDVAPPRQLLVPQLPHPPFRAAKPPRFFWHPAYIPLSDEYAPSCLLAETEETLPMTDSNSASISPYVRHALPKKGILRQNQDGFVYLELPDEFITDIFPLIQDQECEPVGLYMIDPSPAHIPVILPHEWAQKKGWGPINELEKDFPIEVKGLCFLNPKRWPGVDKAYFMEIKSPELERLREHHLLPSLIRGHTFHIAIAFRKAEVSLPQETFRLNVSCFAA